MIQPMQTAKVIVAGSTTIDLIFLGKIFSQRKTADRLSLAYGGKYIVDEFYQFCGGGGANVSVSLSRQGIPTWLWSKVSQDNFGKIIYENLKREKVNLEFVERMLKNDPISAILLDYQGLRTIINYRAEADKLTFSDALGKQLKDFSWLALFSLPLWPKEEKIKVLKFAKENKVGIFLSLHADEYRRGLAYAAEYFKYSDILDLNVYELSTLLGKKPAALNLRRENFAKVLNIPMVLVTCDINGSYFYSADQSFHQPPIDVKRVDTTGAGDAFSAGFLGKFIKTGDVKKSMEFATRNAVSEIEVLGAQTGLLYDK